MRFYYHLYDLLDADSRLLFMIFYRFRLPVTFVRDRHVALLLAMTIKGIPFFSAMTQRAIIKATTHMMAVGRDCHAPCGGSQ